jgi:hypothetical protein
MLFLRPHLRAAYLVSSDIDALERRSTFIFGNTRFPDVVSVYLWYAVPTGTVYTFGILG